MLLQIVATKECGERVFERLRCEEEKQNVDTLILEMIKCIARCVEGAPDTHVKLEIIKDTGVTFSVVKRPSVALCNPSSFSLKYFVTSFESLSRLAIPATGAIINAQGVIYKFGSGGSTKEGIPVQSAYLQDERGDILKVVVHDKWAEHERLQIKNFVQFKTKSRSKGTNAEFRQYPLGGELFI